MAERLTPEEIYYRHGSWGNNTTIPLDERQMIAAAEPEIGAEIGKAVFRGEEALHYLFSDYGQAPKGQWFDFENINIMSPKPTNPAEVPLVVQRNEQKKFRRSLSKSPENLKKHYDRKPSLRLRTIFES